MPLKKVVLHPLCLLAYLVVSISMLAYLHREYREYRFASAWRHSDADQRGWMVKEEDPAFVRGILRGKFKGQVRRMLGEPDGECQFTHGGYAFDYRLGNMDGTGGKILTIDFCRDQLFRNVFIDEPLMVRWPR